MTEDPIQGITVGGTASLEFSFTPEVVAQYANLIGDHAPVHFDAEFARGRGFADRIVHGMFIASLFSGLLGNELPGAHSVINQLTIKLHRAVVVGDTLRYLVTVAQVTPSVRAVMLKLEARSLQGDLVLSGSAVCSLPRRS